MGYVLILSVFRYNSFEETKKKFLGSCESMSRAYQLVLESVTDGDLAKSSIVTVVTVVTVETTSQNPSMRLPHPMPYQGSKRNLAAKILSFISVRKFRRLYEQGFTVKRKRCAPGQRRGMMVD